MTRIHLPIDFAQRVLSNCRSSRVGYCKWDEFCSRVSARTLVSCRDRPKRMLSAPPRDSPAMNIGTCQHDRFIRRVVRRGKSGWEYSALNRKRFDSVCCSQCTIKFAHSLSRRRATQPQQPAVGPLRLLRSLTHTFQSELVISQHLWRSRQRFTDRDCLRLGACAPTHSMNYY